MRIIMLDTKPIRRGAQIFLYDLGIQLKQRGVEVKRIYLYKDFSNKSMELDKEDEALEGLDSNIFEKILTLQPALVLKLIKSIKAFNPDLILLNGSRTLKYGVAAKRISGGKYKLIYRVIDSPKFWNTAFFKKWYYKKIIIPYIDASVAVSDASRIDMQELYNFSKPVTVIHRAVDFDSFAQVPSRVKCREQFSLATDVKLLIFLGNITKQKRPDRFLKIVKKVKENNPDVVAWIIGDGPLRGETEDRVISEKMDPYIKFWGYQSHVGPFLAAADILLLTSDTEGLPGIVPEAAYFKVPTVATNVGGVKECIDDGKSGFIAEKEDTSLFIEKVHTLLNNRNLLTEMGECARIKALAEFDIKNISTEYNSFFKSHLN